MKKLFKALKKLTLTLCIVSALLANTSHIRPGDNAIMPLGDEFDMLENQFK